MGFFHYISFFCQSQSSENVKWPSSQNSFKPFPFKEFNLCNKYRAFSWEAFPFKMSNYMWRANFHLETSLRIFPLHNLGREIFSSWITYFFFFFFKSGPVSRAVGNCLIQSAKAFQLILGSTFKQICKIHSCSLNIGKFHQGVSEFSQHGFMWENQPFKKWYMEYKWLNYFCHKTLVKPYVRSRIFSTLKYLRQHDTLDQNREKIMVHQKQKLHFSVIF